MMATRSFEGVECITLHPNFLTVCWLGSMGAANNLATTAIDKSIGGRSVFVFGGRECVSIILYQVANQLK